MNGEKMLSERGRGGVCARHLARVAGNHELKTQETASGFGSKCK